MPTIKVRLNGTNENHWHRYGLMQNPFPQLARAEYDIAERRLNSLDGDPIPHDNAEAYIREKLDGFAPEFIDKCVEMFEPGKRVVFEVSWPE